MARLRLAMLSRRFWPGIGSAESMLSQLACGLADRDCQITVVTAQRFRHWPTQIDYHGFPVVRAGPMPQGFWRRRQARTAVEDWLRKHLDEIDLVYVLGLHEEAATVVRAIDGRRAVVLAPLGGGRFGDCCWQVACSGRRWIKNACLSADSLVASSPAVRGELEAAGYPRTKIHDIWLGAEAAQQNTQEGRATARSELAEANSMLFVAPKTPLAVCTTRLSNDSGWETLLAAWSMVVATHATAKLWLIGEPALRGPVLLKINELRLEDRVQLIGAMDSVEAVVAAADLLVAPSPHGSHMAILEAMAAGLPTVAADTTVNRWLLADGQAGLLVPPADPRALAQGISSVLDEPDSAPRLNAAARRRASGHFSLAKMLDDHLTLFQTLLLSRNESAP